MNLDAYIDRSILDVDVDIGIDDIYTYLGIYIPGALEDNCVTVHTIPYHTIPTYSLATVYVYLVTSYLPR